MSLPPLLCQEGSGVPQDSTFSDRAYNSSDENRELRIGQIFPRQQALHIGILVFHGPVGIGRRAVGAVEIVTQGAKVRGELSAVVRGMSDAAHENPGTVTFYIEETAFFFQPRLPHALKLGR